MASISKEPNGRRTIQFVGPDGKRRSVRLGKVPQRTAEEIRTRVELLNTANIMGQPVDGDTAHWLATREQKLLDKLAAVGLTVKGESRPATTVGGFLCPSHPAPARGGAESGADDAQIGTDSGAATRRNTLR